MSCGVVVTVTFREANTVEACAQTDRMRIVASRVQTDSRRDRDEGEETRLGFFITRRFDDRPRR